MRALVGPRTPEQFDDTLGALAVSLTDDEVDRIEAPNTPRWPPVGRD